MNTRMSPIMGGLVLSLGGATAIAQWVRLTRSTTEFTVETHRLEEAFGHIRVISSLRRQLEVRSLGGAPAQDILQRLNECLSACGIPPEVLVDLRQLGDEVIRDETEAGSPLRRQTMSASLRGITLGELGAMLESWRNAHPAWTIARVVITRQRDQEMAPAGDDPLQAAFDIQLTLATTYLDG